MLNETERLFSKGGRNRRWALSCRQIPGGFTYGGPLPRRVRTRTKTPKKKHIRGGRK